MAIREKDIKKLWGRAAGRCSKPGCARDLLENIDLADPVVLGEMAHVIAKKPGGPRGEPGGGDDTYANLILLCPTHHRLVDKAPEGTFPEDVLLGWKADHEARVRQAWESPVFESKSELCRWADRLLTENHVTWRTYGPESDVAERNPISELATIWTLRKLSAIIPNNRRIINAVRAHGDWFTPDEYDIYCSFVEHAEGFEASAYERRADVPRFPVHFQELIRACAME